MLSRGSFFGLISFSSQELQTEKSEDTALCQDLLKQKSHYPQPSMQETDSESRDPELESSTRLENLCFSVLGRVPGKAGFSSFFCMD